MHSTFCWGDGEPFVLKFHSIRSTQPMGCVSLTRPFHNIVCNMLSFTSNGLLCECVRRNADTILRFFFVNRLSFERFMKRNRKRRKKSEALRRRRPRFNLLIVFVRVLFFVCSFFFFSLFIVMRCTSIYPQFLRFCFPCVCVYLHIKSIFSASTTLHSGFAAVRLIFFSLDFFFHLV